jgi:hypothetical protein
MTKITAPVLLLALVVAAPAAATGPPIVPRAAQLQIVRRAPGLAYAPTRIAIGFRYAGWQQTSTVVRISFSNRAGKRIRFVVRPQAGSCRRGMEKSFQLAGNKVYWSRTNAEQQAWRCVARPDGRLVRLVASTLQPSTRFADVGLGRIVASGKRIRT